MSDIETIERHLRSVPGYRHVLAPSRSLWARVWAKVDFDGPGGCWLWTGAMSHKRRGKRPAIQIGGRGSKVVNPARLVLEWFQGPPPSPDHEAGHTCPDGENARCVHPLHLAWMTRQENEDHKRAYL